MFAHQSYLKLGDFSGTDFLSLTKNGYELSRFEFTFQQGIDNKGKASTEVYGGNISCIMTMLPPNPIIEWALNSRMYKKGAIVVLDDHNVPQDKILFENAICVDLDVNYTQQGSSFPVTRLELRAEVLMFGNGLDFDNFWTK